MWAKVKHWCGWLVAALLLLVGSTAMWRRKRCVQQTYRAFQAHQKAKAVERVAAQLRAAKERALDRKVQDARSRGSLVDHFNE